MMGAVVALDGLLQARRVWRGAAAEAGETAEPTGHAGLDAALPGGGWPAHALSEILLAADGTGELALVLPALARLAGQGRRLLLVAPPYRVHAPGWAHAGVALAMLQVVEAGERDALWAAEQCLRSAACGAVLCWPRQADDRALRRLQVAAETGQCLGFAFRDARHACNPSPAALRLLVEAGPSSARQWPERPGREAALQAGAVPEAPRAALRAMDDKGPWPVQPGCAHPAAAPQVRVLKCRGGLAPARPIALAS